MRTIRFSLFLIIAISLAGLNQAEGDIQNISFGNSPVNLGIVSSFMNETNDDFYSSVASGDSLFALGYSVETEKSSIYWIDISDPNNPYTAYTTTLPIYLSEGNRLAKTIKISGDYLYVANSDNGVAVYKIGESPTNGLILSHATSTPGRAYDTCIWGGHLLVADSYEGIAIMNLSSDGSQISYWKNIDWPGSTTREIDVLGNYAYITDLDYGLGRIDLTMIDDYPSYLGGNDIDEIFENNVLEQGTPHSTKISGNYAYVLSIYNFWIVDISNHAEINVIAECEDVVNIDEVLISSAQYDCGGYDLDIKGNYAYIASDARGMKIINITNSTSPNLVWVSDTYSNGPGTGGSNLLGYSRGVAIHNDLVIVSDSYLGRIDILNFDMDKDGVANMIDLYPENPTEWYDSDGDGVGNNADAFPYEASEWKDADGDGVGDNSDLFPMDSSEWVDTDNDNVGDNSDLFPSNSSEWADSDNDNIGDNSDEFPLNSLEWKDADNDGFGDRKEDLFPSDPAASKDTDGDGYPDEWNLNMSKLDSSTFLVLDEFPSDGQEWADSDNDGVGDNGDFMPNFSPIQTITEVLLIFFILSFMAYVGVGHTYTKNVFSEIEEKLENENYISDFLKEDKMNTLNKGKTQWKILNYFMAVEIARGVEKEILELSDDYISTEKQILDVEKGLEKLEKSGIDVEPAMMILEKSRNELSNMDFEEAHNSSSFAEETGIELEITEEQFLKVHSGLEKLKDSGVDVRPAMKILEEGKNELSNMNCSNSDIVLETLDIGPTRMELFSANKNARNSSALAEEKGIELKEQYEQTLGKINDLKEKIKHLSDRKIKAEELKKLLKTMEKEVVKVE